MCNIGIQAKIRSKEIIIIMLGNRLIMKSNLNKLKE